ncbi:hypothetical protein [Brevundimonas sp. GCM10030266]|uniref:hypothetical protein n=1 Tax=Brevundimonas sp. GCM10030266 TaxID=3273386 RepID=UPI003610ADBA
MSTITVDLNSKVVPAAQKIWIVHPGRNRSHIDTFESAGVVFLEFPALALRPEIIADDSLLRQRIRYSTAVKANKGFVRDDGTPIHIADYPTAADTDVSVHLRTVKHLTTRMMAGDLVIVPGRGAGGAVLFGEVAGSFFPQKSIRAAGLPFADTPVREVNWLTKRSKLELPAHLVKFFEKPPAIAEVGRDRWSEGFFDFAYDAYSTDARSWVSLDAPQYDGSDILSLVPPAELLALAVSLYRAMEQRADLTGLDYDQIIARFYDHDALAEAQMRFQSPGRYNLKDKDAKLAKWINGFVALALAGALSACSNGDHIEFTNKQAPNDPANAELTAMINMAGQSAGGAVLTKAETQAQHAQSKLGMSAPATVR